jgi:hypothetical protein
MPDEALVAAIRKLLAASPFHGEGHRKVWARLRFAGIRTSKRRVLRLMRAHDLLAPNRVGRPHGPKAHDGTIRTARVDEIWGTDLTSIMTGEGQAPVGCGVPTAPHGIFVTVDHCSTECVGIHAARRATRLEALEPLRQGVPTTFGGFAGGIAGGLKLATTTAASSSPTTTSARSPSSASRARRLSCASPRATAVPNASSEP